MTLKHLKIFICVAKNENITHAAEELYMTQPAVSLAISQLEEYYKIKLFERIKQRIKITEEGKILLQYANSIINNFEEFEDIAFNKSINKTIKFGCSLSVGEKLIPNLMTNVSNKNNIYFKVDTSNNILEDILNANLDFGVVETPKLDPRLKVIELTGDPLVFLVNNNFDIPNEISVEQLIKYPLLLRNKNTGVRETFDNLLKSNNLIVNPQIESVSNLSLLEFAKSGFGIAVLPKVSINDKNNLKEIKIKEIELIRPISLIYKQNKIINEEENIILNHIKNNIKLI